MRCFVVDYLLRGVSIYRKGGINIRFVDYVNIITPQFARNVKAVTIISNEITAN